MNQLGEKSIRFSQNENAINDKQILVIDNIGMLSSIYRYASIAYIGGGFENGIHNILEAAVYGIPVLFGPNFIKSNEAKDLISQKSCFCIHNEPDFTSTINQLLNDKKQYEQCVIDNSGYVKNKSGATDQIVKYINKEILKNKSD